MTPARQPEKATQNGSQTIAVNVKDLQNGNINPASLQDSKAVTETDLQRLDDLAKTINQYRNLTTVRTITLNKPSGTKTHIDSILIRAMPGASHKETFGQQTVTVKTFIILKLVSGKSIFTKHKFSFSQGTDEIVPEDKEQFNELMNFKPSDITFDIPALDPSEIDVAGYTWHITSASPNGATYGAETYHIGDPVQNIVIDYTPIQQNHSVTYQFIDQDNKNANVGTPVTVSGEPGKSVTVSDLKIPANYHLASGQLPTSVTIGDTDQSVSLYLKHNTQNTNDSKSITRIINVTNPNGKVNTTKQTATLSRTGVKDLVTNTTTWQNWNTGKWDRFTTPTIAGYTPTQMGVEGQNVDVNTQDNTVNITYNADPQKATVEYIDDTDNKTVATKELNGHTGETSNYSTADEISNLEKQGYVLVSDNYPKGGLVFDNDDQQDQTIEVHLNHGTTTVTPDKPGTPGQPIDPTNPDGPKYPTGTDKDSLQSTVTRTINYVYQNGKQAESPVNDSLHFTDTKVIDKVTGEVISDKWSPAQDFKKITTPTIEGYTANRSSISNTNIDHDHPAITETVTYTPNDQTTHVVYVDKNSKKTIKTDTVSGKTDQTVNTNSTVPTGWELVPGQQIPSTITFTGAKTPDTSVLIQHSHTKIPHTKPVPEDGKTPTNKLINGGHDSDLNQTITRTINVTNPSGKTTTTVQTAKIYRDGTVDNVTGEVTYSDWSTDTTSWTDFKPESIDGYTPSQSDVSAVTVKNGQKNVTVDIAYKPNKQSTSIVYKDGDTTVKTDPLNGVTDKTVDVKTNVPAGYKITNPKSVPSNYKFKASGNDPIIVPLEHQITTVTPTDPKTPKDTLPNNPDKYYPDGVSEKDLNKTIVRKITVVKPDGTRESHDQSVKLTRTATVDEVTGKVTGYSDWTTSSFKEYDADPVPGYTPSGKASAVNVTNTSDFTPIEISYTPNDQTGKISYVDVKTGDEVGTTPLTGKTNENVTITPVAPTGWKIVDGQSIPQTEKATPTGIVTVTVKVEHNTTTVQPTDPKTPSDKLPDNPDKHYPDGVGEKDLNKTITRTITVKNPHTGDQVTNQTAKLTRTATVDEVTGEVTYSDWVPGTWDNFEVPTVSGYTPSQNNVPQQSVTDGTKDTTVTITYTPTDQTGKILYVDPNGKEVGNTPLTGKTDEEIPVTPNVPAGWQIVPGQDIPTTITATPDGIPTVTVKVEHKIITVTPTDPKTPSDKLPDNPGKNYPKGVGTTDLNKTITRKITVIKPDGTKEAHDQTVNLTRTATVDEVTSQVTGYSDWTTSSFAEYDAPEIPGYTPSGNAPAVALVTSTSDFTPVVITYIPTDQTVKYKFVDPQGKVVGVQTVPVNIHIPDGYQLVPSESVPTSYTFKDGNPDQIIKVALIPNNGGQPTTNDHQGQGTPATNTPTNTTPNGNDVTGKLEGNVPNVQTGKTITSQSTTANKDNQLPQTGNAGEKNAQIFGALSAGLAALVAGFVPNRRRDNKQ